MVNKMSKENLLRMLDTTVEHTVKVEGNSTIDADEITFELRPLSDGELSKEEAMLTKGVNVDTNSLNTQNMKKIRRLRDKGASKKEIARKLQNELNADINVGKLSENEKNATYYVAAKALSVGDNEWSEKEVAKLPKGVPGSIANKARKISDIEIREGTEEEENL